MVNWHVPLGLFAALAFATGATIAIFGLRLWRSFRRSPEVVLKRLLGKYLGGRAAFVCAACDRVHIVPALRRRADGSPDWVAPMPERDAFMPMQMLLHEGQPLQVIARRIAERERLTFFGVLALLMTRDERAHALAALRGEAADELVDALIHETLRGSLRVAIEERNALDDDPPAAASSPRPATHRIEIERKAA